jgi:hypothetical protein
MERLSSVCLSCVCVLSVLQVKLCVCLCFCVFFRRLCANFALCWMLRSGSVKGLLSVTPGGYFRRTGLAPLRFVSLFLSLCVCVLSVLL